MPRSPEDNAEIRSARREAILAAAMRVFSERGFERAKISDIAREAGLSHGLVYHYFDSKDAIFAAITDLMMSRVDDDMTSVAHERAFDRIVTALERHRARLCEPVDAHCVIMQSILQGSMPEALRARAACHFAGTSERLRAWIEEAQADGDVDPTVPAGELTAALLLLVRGMSLRIPGGDDLPFELPRTQTIVDLLRPKRPYVATTQKRTTFARKAGSGPLRPKNRGLSRANPKHRK